MARVPPLDTEIFAHAGQRNSFVGPALKSRGASPTRADGSHYFIQRTCIRHDHVPDRQMAWQGCLSQTFAEAAVGKVHTDPGLLCGNVPRTP